jgi:hypothetical protein
MGSFLDKNRAGKVTQPKFGGVAVARFILDNSPPLGLSKTLGLR